VGCHTPKEVDRLQRSLSPGAIARSGRYPSKKAEAIEQKAETIEQKAEAIEQNAEAIEQKGGRKSSDNGLQYASPADCGF
jgi:hypothetical protein